MKKCKYLETDRELQLCVLNKVKVEVIFFGQVDYVGIIKCFDEQVIEFKNSYYFRENIKLKLSKKNVNNT